MRSVPGIDAAWTTSNPSGFSPVMEDDTRWRLEACSPSYAHLALQGDWACHDQALGSMPDARALFEACVKIAGEPPDLVAVDMPVAMSPLIARRTSNDAVSAAYGARHAGTHSPSVSRPGPISDALRADFHALGYPLQTERIACPGLIEVYFHPALIELASASRRLPYKAGETRDYWRELGVSERRERLLSTWRGIVSRLDAQIEGVSSRLPLPLLDASVRLLKAFEDILDAVVCAWVGVRALEGRARPYGDAMSAIWVLAPE